MNINFEYYDENLDKTNKYDESLNVPDDIKANIVSWYPFKKNATILEIDSINLHVTSKLLENATKMVSICSSKKKAEEMEYKLYGDSDNLDVIVGNFENIKLNEKFDYVTLIGTIDVYKEDTTTAKNKFAKLIEYAKEYVKDDGKILISIDNTFGMKYWTSIYADRTVICNDKNTMYKEDINEILNKNNILNYKYYYPLPDYRYVNAIFTDDYLPNVDSISRNYTYPVDEYVSYNETEAYEKILKYDKEQFKFFATNFFIEASKREFENDIRFVSYTNSRKKDYRVITTMHKDQVIKKSESESSKLHLEHIKRNINILNEKEIKTLDSYDDDSIISRYVRNAKSYDEILISIVKEKSEDELIKEFKMYYEKLKEKFKRVYPQENVFDRFNIVYDKKIDEKMYYIKDGLWDLTFQNSFIVDDDIYFYDQEWYEENIPLEFIMYRSIVYFPELERYIKSEKLFEVLGINEFLYLFKALDNKLQENIRDEESWRRHSDLKTGQLLLNRFKDSKNETESIRQILDVRTKDYDELANRYNELAKAHLDIINSKAWKLLGRPIRKVENIGKEDKNKRGDSK